MSTNRIHLGAVGLMVTIGLLLALAVQAGSPAAATGTSAASSSKAVQGAVSIHLWGPEDGGRLALMNLGGGSFTISGAISDRGAFVGDRYGEPGRGVRIFFGARGTIHIFVGHYGGWRITKGTNAYAGLRGLGTGGSLWHRNQGPVDSWMYGTVSQ